MIRALLLGGAACVYDDAREAERLAAEAGVTFDMVIAVNQIGIHWPRITDWVTCHQEFFLDWQRKRAAAGHSNDYRTCAQDIPKAQKPRIDLVIGKQWGGSSGLFAVQYARKKDAERIVCCGIPMTKTPHFNTDKPWPDVDSFTLAWKRWRHEYALQTCSMSGWTAARLGQPTIEWLQGADKATMWQGVGDAVDGSGRQPRRR